MAKILLVDDEPDVVLIVSERLRRNGHEVDCSTDGNQALQKITGSSYDLLVLDIRMPVYSGYEICEYAKSSDKNERTPVLLISAFPEEQTNWRQSKADAFLAKPFETGALVAAIDRLVKGVS